MAMKTRTRRVLMVLGALLLLLVGTVGAIGYSTFGGMAPIVDGQRLGEHIEIVQDSFVSVAILDIGDGHVALIDCGNDPEAQSIQAALARRGLGFADVSAVLVTHGHPDHVSGCSQFTAATFYVIAADIVLAGALLPEPRQALTDGQIVTLGNLSVTAYALPGHTPGSAVFLVDGALFVGDSAGVSADHHLLGAPWVFSEDTAENLASLRGLGLRLADVADVTGAADVRGAPGATWLVPAHSGVLEGDVAGALAGM